MKFGLSKKIEVTKNNKFFLVLCIPIVLTVLFLYFSNSYYMKNYREKLISIYANEFNQSLKNIEETLNSVMINSSAHITNTDIRYIINAEVGADEIEQSTLSEVKNTLFNIEKQFQIIDSIAVVNRRNGFVVTANGIYDMNGYFEHCYVYGNYPAEYWRNLSASKDHSRILQPTSTKIAGVNKEKNITPLVLGTYNSNIIIYNFDGEKLYDSFLAHYFTPNSCFYMRSISNDRYITNAQTQILTEESEDAEFKDRLTQFSTNYCLVDKIKLSGKNYYRIKTTERSELFGYEYGVLVPFSDVNDYTHPILINLIYYILAAMLLLTIYAVFGSYFFYSPWQRLAKRIFVQNSGSKEEYYDLNNITDMISNIFSENADLNKNLNKTLSYSQQKYVTDILNNVSDGTDEDMNSLIFKNDYFISVVISVSISLPLSAATAEVDERALTSELFLALKSVFDADFTAFKIPSSGNYMYLLLNVADENAKTIVDEKIEEIRTLLAEDKNYMDIYFGTGDIHKGIEGLKQTHSEALSRIHSKINSERVSIDNVLPAGADITANIEGILTNYIVAGYSEQCEVYLKSVFEQCNRLSYRQCQQVYLTVICVLYKITEIKGKSCADIFDGKSELEFLNETLKLSADEIQESIIRTVHKIIGDGDYVLSKNLDIAKVTEYIEQHYNEDLYLDNLADKFEVSKKYLSKKINQHLGIAFKTYLTQLRVNKAEEMLKEGDFKISDIYMLVGFYNRSTFIRAFKQKTGLTPSEYRALYKNSEKDEEKDE